MALKVAVVGLRGIGTTHAQSYSKDELSKLVAVCDVVKDRADKLAKDLGVNAYYRVADLLAGEPELDIVDVSTGGYENGGWHFEPVMQALAAGKNVLVEKPISNDIHNAREMVRFAAEKDVYLGCRPGSSSLTARSASRCSACIGWDLSAAKRPTAATGVRTRTGCRISTPRHSSRIRSACCAISVATSRTCRPSWTGRVSAGKPKT